MMACALLSVFVSSVECFGAMDGSIVLDERECEVAARIEQSLDQECDMLFDDATLVEVVDYLKMRGVPSHINVRALDDVGISTDVPITFSQRSIRLRDGLDLLLKELRLCWVIHSGHLVITTAEEAESHLLVQVYDVRNLVEVSAWGVGVDSSGTSQVVYRYDFDALVNAITSTISPVTWGIVGGPGAIEAYHTRRMRVLVVSQTQDVHRQIRALLEKMAEYGGVTPLAPPQNAATLPRQAFGTRRLIAGPYLDRGVGLRSSRLRRSGG